jgi:hypothetical protein
MTGFDTGPILKGPLATPIFSLLRANAAMTIMYDQSVAIAHAEKIAFMAMLEPRLINVIQQLTTTISQTHLTGAWVRGSKWYQNL